MTNRIFKPGSAGIQTSLFLRAWRIMWIATIRFERSKPRRWRDLGSLASGHAGSGVELGNHLTIRPIC